MTPQLELVLQVILETLTLFALIVGLLGLIVPVFPGLAIMWLGTLLYALIQNAAGHMTGWKWFLFAVITLLMITGSIGDNIIIARKMRDRYIPWSSILFAFAASTGCQYLLYTLDRARCGASWIISGRKQTTKKPRRRCRFNKNLHDRLGLGIRASLPDWAGDYRLLDDLGLGSLTTEKNLIDQAPE